LAFPTIATVRVFYLFTWTPVKRWVRITTDSRDICLRRIFRYCAGIWTSFWASSFTAVARFTAEPIPAITGSVLSTEPQTMSLLYPPEIALDLFEYSPGPRLNSFPSNFGDFMPLRDKQSASHTPTNNKDKEKKSQRRKNIPSPSSQLPAQAYPTSASHPNESRPASTKPAAPAFHSTVSQTATPH